MQGRVKLNTSFSYAEFDVNEKSKLFISQLSEQYHQYKGAAQLPLELIGKFLTMFYIP